MGKPLDDVAGKFNVMATTLAISNCMFVVFSFSSLVTTSWFIMEGVDQGCQICPKWMFKIPLVKKKERNICSLNMHVRKEN